MYRSVKWGMFAGLILLLAGALLVSACGDDDDDDDGGSTPTATATADDSSDSDSGGTSNNGTSDNGASDDDSSGSGGGSFDIDKVLEDLTPPNATETARFTAAEGTNVVFESDESIDALEEFYDGRIDDLGIEVATFDAADSHSWIFGSEGSFGGGVTLTPSGDGKSVVTITIAAE